MNGNTIGFHPQTQELELPDEAPSFTLGVKWILNFIAGF